MNNDIKCTPSNQHNFCFAQIEFFLEHLVLLVEPLVLLFLFLLLARPVFPPLRFAVDVSLFCVSIDFVISVVLFILFDLLAGLQECVEQALVFERLLGLFLFGNDPAWGFLQFGFRRFLDDNREADFSVGSG